MEFSNKFFDIIGKYLLVVVEESRMKGYVSDSLKSTFIVLLTKTSKPDTFNVCRMIFLCNLVYKVITKLIPNTIKQILEKCMTIEQFIFLQNRQIQDGMGVSQEGLHFIKLKNLSVMGPKMDLTKE